MYKQRNFIQSLALLLLPLLIVIAMPAQSYTNSQLHLVVKGLGVTRQNAEIAQDLDILQTNAHSAVAMLVLELHPIPQEIYYEKKKTNTSRHVIACLRALHYLTGETFTAKTKSKLTDDESQFLDFKNELHDSNPAHELHFFSVWMSRNADFVAPIDVQQNIIGQWKRWQKANGDSFQYKPKPSASSSDDWYWHA